MLRINPLRSLTNAFVYLTVLVSCENANPQEQVNKPLNRDTVSQNASPQYPLVIPNPKQEQELVEERFKRSIERNPLVLRSATTGEIFRYFYLYKDHPFARNLLTIATMRDPIGTKKYFEIHRYNYPDLKSYADLQADATFLTELKENLHEKKGLNGIRDRQRFLNWMIRAINPEILHVLEEFNRQNNLSLKCMGINPEPYEFVCINTFKGNDKLPLRIGISYPELRDNKSKEDLAELIQRKVSNRRLECNEQYNIWEKPHDYDLPKGGKTACILIAVPENKYGRLTGMEANFAELAKIYTGRYEAEIYAVCMQRTKEWLEIVSKEEITGLPQPAPATKESILKHLGVTLRRAIDDKKEALLVHYMMHGGTDGSMDAANGVLLPSEFANVISGEHNGKPMCAQIDINLLAMPSCFSENQTSRVISSLENMKGSDGKRIAVKGLRIINDSSYDTPSDCTRYFYNSLVHNDNTLVGAYKSAASVYYLSSYYNLIDFETKEGFSYSPPVGTFTHAMQFVNEMLWSITYRDDSKRKIYRQDLQGWFYSYDPEEDEVQKLLFSKNWITPTPPFSI